jgi:hypothetical protein
LCFATACAADPGDASKTTEGITTTPDGGGVGMLGSDSGAGGGGLDSGGGGGGLDSGGGGGFVDVSSSSPDATQMMTVNDSGGGTGLMDSGGVVDAPSTGPEASMDAATGPEASIPDAAKEASPPVDAGPDCLKNIPATCPDCMTQNASDKPACEMYITCYMTNSCDPTTACGDNDGVCGVNKIGGGEAPEQAAMTTYMCACP